MNISLMGLEIGVLVLALGILLMDLWMPADRKRLLGYLAAAGVGLMLAYSFVRPPPTREITATFIPTTNTVGTAQTIASNLVAALITGATNLPVEGSLDVRSGSPAINGSYVM